MNLLRFNGRKVQFQTAIKMAITCALKLQETLKNVYGINYLLTSRITQDSLENFFSQIRGMFGQDQRPDARAYTYRLEHHVTNKVF